MTFRQPQSAAEAAMLGLHPSPFGIEPWETGPAPQFSMPRGFGLGPAAPEPFIFGKGGAKMTPEQVSAMRDQAQREMAQGADFSPVGHWTQGLARALDGLTGGIKARKAEKADAALAAESDAVTQALLANPDKQTVLAAIANPNLTKGARSVAELLAEPMFAKPGAPHYWETNDGSLGMVGPDGKPVVLYKDPTPKVDWVRAENGDGTITLTPMVNGQVAGGGGQASGAPETMAPPAEAIADLRADPSGAAEFDEVFGPGAAARVLGGGAGNGVGGFPGGG